MVKHDSLCMASELYMFRIVFSLVALGIGVMSALIILKLREDHQKAMVRFQLNKTESIMDFKIFFYANLFMVASFLMFWYGSLAKNSVLVFYSRYSLAIYGLVLIMLLYRWWRRF